MSREIYQDIKTNCEWYGLFARAVDYKDIDGNRKIDHLVAYKGNYKKGDLIKFTNSTKTQDIYFYILKVENTDGVGDDNNWYSFLTGYWVWSVYAGTVKTYQDLPDNALEGEYYLIKPSKTTTIKDYVYYERVGDEWKPMGSYWG